MSWACWTGPPSTIMEHVHHTRSLTLVSARLDQVEDDERRIRAHFRQRAVQDGALPPPRHPLGRSGGRARQGDGAAYDPHAGSSDVVLRTWSADIDLHAPRPSRSKEGSSPRGGPACARLPTHAAHAPLAGGAREGRAGVRPAQAPLQGTHNMPRPGERSSGAQTERSTRAFERYRLVIDARAAAQKQHLAQDKRSPRTRELPAGQAALPGSGIPPLPPQWSGAAQSPRRVGGSVVELHESGAATARVRPPLSKGPPSQPVPLSVRPGSASCAHHRRRAAAGGPGAEAGGAQDPAGGADDASHDVQNVQQHGDGGASGGEAQGPGVAGVAGARGAAPLRANADDGEGGVSRPRAAWAPSPRHRAPRFAVDPPRCGDGPWPSRGGASAQAQHRPRSASLGGTGPGRSRADVAIRLQGGGGIEGRIENRVFSLHGHPAADRRGSGGGGGGSSRRRPSSATESRRRSSAPALVGPALLELLGDKAAPLADRPYAHLAHILGFAGLDASGHPLETGGVEVATTANGRYQYTHSAGESGWGHVGGHAPEHDLAPSRGAEAPLDAPEAVGDDKHGVDGASAIPEGRVLSAAPAAAHSAVPVGVRTSTGAWDGHVVHTHAKVQGQEWEQGEASSPLGVEASAVADPAPTATAASPAHHPSASMSGGSGAPASATQQPLPTRTSPDGGAGLTPDVDIRAEMDELAARRHVDSSRARAGEYGREPYGVITISRDRGAGLTSTREFLDVMRYERAITRRGAA